MSILAITNTYDDALKAIDAYCEFVHDQSALEEIRERMSRSAIDNHLYVDGNIITKVEFPVWSWSESRKARFRRNLKKRGIEIDKIGGC